MNYISNWEILLRLAIATALGVLFGFERNKSAKPVGIRTHVLICLTACVVALISSYGFADYETHVATAVGKAIDVRSDPARLVVGVLTGIGFIGAGIIWKTPSGSVHGITTAAEIFLLAALGIGTGMGMYFLVGAATVIAIVNMIADDLQAKYRKKKAARQVVAQVKEKAKDEAAETAPPEN